MIISLDFNELLFEVFILYSYYFIESLSPFTVSPISISESPVTTPTSTPSPTPTPTASTPTPTPTPTASTPTPTASTPTPTPNSPSPTPTPTSSTPSPTPNSPSPTPSPTPTQTQTLVPTSTLSVQKSVVINGVTYTVQEKTYQSFKSYEYCRYLGNKNVFNISSKDGNLFPVKYNGITYSIQFNYYSKYDDLKIQLIRVIYICLLLISRILQDLEFPYRRI